MEIYRSNKGYYVLNVNGKDVGNYDTVSEAVNDYETEYRDKESD